MLHRRGVETVILAGADTHGIMRASSTSATWGVDDCVAMRRTEAAAQAVVTDWETESCLEAL